MHTDSIKASCHRAWALLLVMPVLCAGFAAAKGLAPFQVLAYTASGLAGSLIMLMLPRLGDELFPLDSIALWLPAYAMGVYLGHFERVDLWIIAKPTEAVLLVVALLVAHLGHRWFINVRLERKRIGR